MLFSGYDCDSLALDPVTGFTARFIPALTKIERAWLELRTKSTQIRSLLDMPAQCRCVRAFSLSPQGIIDALEHKTPELNARLDAMQRLAEHGWPVGIRFDPLIMVDNFETVYGHLFDTVFTRLDASNLHSITLGAFCMPPAFAKKIVRLYPEEPLYPVKLDDCDGILSYPAAIVKDMPEWSAEHIGAYIPAERIFAQTT